MDSRTRDAAVSRTSAVRAGWMGLLTGRTGRAVFAAGTGTGTMKMAGQWTDARRAMGRLHRCGPRRPPESSPHSPGGSSSASNRRASRPSAASRAGSVACYAGGFLVAFAALLALPLQAQAQTVVTLVNSLSQTEGQSSTALGNHWEVAQGFTTGSNAAGYTLTNIRSVFPSILNNMPSLTVTLHKDAPTNAAIATLTNPATIEVGQLTFTAPANTTLDAATTYYVLFHGENIWLESTTSDNEDTNGLSDWSVEDVRYRRDDRTTGAFTEVAVSTPIRVRGTVDVATPTVSISADKTTAVFKEDGITYTLTRTGSTTAALDVSISLSQPDGKDFLLAADLPQTVTIAAGQSTNTFTIAASSFQHFAAGTMVEGGTLTAVVEDEDGPGGDYDLGTPFSVNVAIVIGMTVRFDMASYSVGEADGTLSFKLIARTGAGAPQPSSAIGSINVSTEDGSASNAIDFAFTDGAENFLPGEFSADGGAWQAENTYNVSITNDALDEDDETFGLTIDRNLAFLSYSLVDASGNSCGTKCTVTVTIVDDDGTPASPRSISIADASAAENAGHLLFEVTLSRALQNTVKVDFETISGGTATAGEDYYARRTYTHVILAGDSTAQMGFAIIEDTVDDAGETVKVRLSNARRVNAYGDKIADLDITRDEATGTINAPSTTTTNVPNLTIRIRDATGSEDSGWLVFKVKLSRKYDDYVCYDFETISGGTATEGTDYLKMPKATYWMQIGKKVDKPFVRIIDDSESDNGETVKVEISNVHVCDDPSQTVSITRAEATGTITETSAYGMDSSDDGEGDDALLARVGDVTPEAATAALFGGDALTGDQLAAMDQLGNRNGAYDLGDLLSWMARCRRNEVSCGAIVSATDAGSLPASPAMPPAKPHSRTPPRRRGNGHPGRRSGGNGGGSVERVPRQRAMRSGAAGRGPGRHGPAVRRVTGWIRALALGLVASAWGCGIGEDVVQPAQPDPGPLNVRLTVPPGARDIGAMLVVEGPGIDSLSAPGFELIQADEASSNRREAIIAGSLSTGPVLQVWVQDRRQLADYRVTLMQVSGDDYALKDLTQYGIAISR